jgi:SWI/SNF-related matrix-associated actin-dependent regulator 1 of chromatin subfamily A
MTIHPSAYNVFFSFGKFNGRSLGEVCNSNRSYLEWMAGADGLPKIWKERCAKVLLGEAIEADGPENPNAVPTGAQFVALKNGKIAVTFDFDKSVIARFKDTIDAKKWNKDDPANKYWEVAAEQLPKLVEFFGGPKNIVADDESKRRYKKEIERRADLDVIRAKEDSDIVIPTKLELYPYQKVGVEFVDRAAGRALIADQMGLGKTAEAIGYAVYKNLKTLIICPKSVKLNWVREILQFAGKSTCVWSTQGKEGRTNAQFHVVNYDSVAKLFPKLKALEFDLLVCDEATALKNYRTERTKTIFGNWKQRKKYPGFKTKHVILLTGTPILNRTMEAFTLLSFLDKNRFNNPLHFKLRYDGQNLDELYDRTKDLVIRRLKSQVANEIPPKQRFDLVVELTDAENKAYMKHLGELFKKWRISGRPSASQMPALRNFLFELKYPRIIEFTDEMLDSGRPVLIFTIHQEHAYRIAKHYQGLSGVITGNENIKERQRVIDSLKAGESKVGVFTIGAGGMGIDGLQHTMDAVLFVDRAWVPALHEQAEDRVHRKGQSGQVQVWYMTAQGTYDEDMAEVLLEKQKIIEKAVDGKEFDVVQNKSMFKEVLRRISQKMMENIGDIDASEETE